MKTLKKLLLILSVSTFIFFTDNVKASISSSYDNYHDEENLIYNSDRISSDYRYAYYYAEENTVYIYSLRSNDWSNSSSYANKVSLDTYPYFYIVYNSYFTGAFTSDSVYFLWSKSPMIFNTSDNYWYSTDSQVYYAGIKYAQSKTGSINSKMANTYSTGALNNGTFKFYSNQDIYNQNGELYQKSNIINIEPNLQYKTGFTSSEYYSVLGKVSVEFQENDNNISKYNAIRFKLQYGSNDWTNENIPVFSHYKLFGKRTEESTWKELSEEDLTFDFEDYEEKITFETLDTTYDYVEGTLADSSITMQLNFLDSISSLYQYWKIEFYLENTNNSYIYCYDSAESSNWTDTAKFLENYIYYYFPSNYKYAFITSNNNINEGSIYFPTNSINNELVKLQGQYYNLQNKTFSIPILTSLYLNDTYYSYLDFSFNDNENILAINRARGNYTYTSYYNPTFLDFWNLKYNPFWLPEFISISEDTYFYVPIGYNVYFTNKANLNVQTSNGFIDIDVENSNNSFESDIFDNQNNNIFDFINNIEMDNNILAYFTKIYNIMRNSKLGNYIFMIIGFSILILVIKSSNRK